VGRLPNFRIETLEDRDRARIEVEGELDSGTCDQLLEHFERAAAAATGAVAIDLTGVSFIDSTGMRTIIVLERRAADTGVALSIVEPREEVTELLRITGIRERIEFGPQAEPAPTPFIERIDIELGREPTAPARARAELRQAIAGRLSQSESATATLLTSELVTNAVIHPEHGTHGPVGLQITAYRDRVRVEVSDTGSGFDLGGERPRPRETGGHGLVVVDGLSSRWGTERRRAEGEERFVVWFELDAGGPEPAEVAGISEVADAGVAEVAGTAVAEGPGAESPVCAAEG
jgi:anti-anti-sigma factor